MTDDHVQNTPIIFFDGFAVVHISVITHVFFVWRIQRAPYPIFAATALIEHFSGMG
jgi:hypothetical protein